MRNYPKVLVTGFGNQKHGHTNPSWIVAQAVAEMNPRSVTCEELSVDYDQIRSNLKGAIERVRPIAVICLGVCMGRPVPTIEKVAHNYLQPSPDDSRVPLVEGAPVAYASTLPIGRIVARSIVDGCDMHPNTHEADDTTQQCNAAMYHALDLCRDTDIKAGFIHVPPLPEYAEAANSRISMPLDPVVGGVLAAVEVALSA